MDGTFETRSHVNSNMLRQFVGQDISIMLCVEGMTGNNLAATSTDDQKLTVTLPAIVDVSKGDWVEVIGSPTGPNAIRAKEAIVFNGKNIDMDKEAYNMMVQFMNNSKDIYRSG